MSHTLRLSFLPGKIILGIFQTVVKTAKTITLFCPGGKVPVYRSYIRKGENIPAFFDIDIDIYGITAEFFQGNGHFIKKPGIDQVFAGLDKITGKLLQGQGIAGFKRKFPVDDITLF